MIAAYIAACAVVCIIATVMMLDCTGRDISQEHAQQPCRLDPAIDERRHKF